MRFLSLRNKFLIITLSIILVLSLIIIVIINNAMYHDLSKEIREKAVFMSEHLAHMSVRPLLTNDTVNLKLLLMDFYNDAHDITYLFINDRGGKVLAHTFENGFPAELKGLNVVQEGIDHKTFRIKLENDFIIDVATPVMNGHLGTVHVGLSERHIQNILHSSLNKIILAIAIVIVISIIVTVIFSGKLTGPLTTLVSAAEAAGTGDLDSKVDIVSSDEIGQLARSFNKMLDDLKESTVSRKNFLKQNMFLLDVVESIPYPFYVVDAGNYSVLLANSAISPDGQWSRYRCHELAYQKDAPCHGSDDVCPLETVKKRKEPVTVEHTHMDKAGNEKVYEVHGYPVFDDEQNVIQMIEYCFDITLRKKAEAELEIYRRQLEHKVAERTAELTQAIELLQDEISQRIEAENELVRHREHLEDLVKERTEELVNANQELRDFAYVVSHDLKAPLRAINTLAQWISSDYADCFDEDGREQMALLMERARRMDALINGVLQYSRVGRIKEEQMDVDLNRLIKDVVDMLDPPDGLHIIIDEGFPTISCEATRMTQVFQNLLSNAIKYMDKPDGWVRVSHGEHSGFWEFSVTDSGPGIEEKHFDRIFQIFQTLKTKDETESTGIGLTLVKKIIEMYGGSVTLESEIGSGSTFSFTFPKQGHSAPG